MRKLLVICGLVLGCLGGVHEARAQFCPGVSPWVFDDVLASDPFCGFITRIAQQSVTLGCLVIDANHRLYCPDLSVTRKQMAAFMARLGDALFPLTCAAGQVLKWNGSAWACANDNTGGGGGTVTSVLAGTGLQGSPNPIIGAGSLNLAPSYQLPQACAANQIPKWNGAAWACGSDSNAGGTVTSVGTGTGLTGGPITGIGTVSIANGGVGTTQLANGSVDVTKLNTISTDARYFKQGGNAFGATATLGTSDNRSLFLRANGLTSWRIEPTTADPANGFNTASPNLIGGWAQNAVTAGVIGATIGGGGAQVGVILYPNRVTDHYGTVGGGLGNTAGDAAGTVDDGPFSTVSGGAANTASGIQSTIGGGNGNAASGISSTIGGGNGNAASGTSSIVGGGSTNTASGIRSAVGGGFVNTASGFDSTVGGGGGNAASGDRSTVGGGSDNTASTDRSTVAGGSTNTASGIRSAVGGGIFNTASGDSSAVGGGFQNTASGVNSTVGGGFQNIASGDYSFAGGRGSEARGDYSMALGRRAKTFSGLNNGTGAIVLADGNDFDFNEFFDNRFAVRSTGGVRFVLGIDAGTGAATYTCSASNGNAWACASDRNLKHSMVELDGRVVLAQLSAVPIYQWQPKGPNAHVKHYGPMAQDFHAAFGLGDDEKMIGMQDADGVALAAIQGLHQVVRERDTEITALKAKSAEVDARLAAQERELAGQRAARDEQVREIAELKGAVEVLLARTSLDGRLARAR